MSLLSFPPIFTHSNCTPFIISEPRNSYHTVKLNKKNLAKAAYVSGPLIKTSFLSSHLGSSLVAFGTKDLGGAAGEEDFRALETVLRLYKAIKDGNTNVISVIMGEECRCVCKLCLNISALPGENSSSGILFLSAEILGEEHSVRGATYISRWDECGNSPETRFLRLVRTDGNSTNLLSELYLGFMQNGLRLAFHRDRVSASTCVIFTKGRNVEMFMEPLLHVEPLRLVKNFTGNFSKIMGFMMNVMDKLGPKEPSKGKAKWTTIYIVGSVLPGSITVLC